MQGIWRRASLDSYKSDNVEWETVLDIDALPPPTKDTAKTWVWHGSNLLDDGQFDRCLISLSPGGSDADTTREFCLKTSTVLSRVGLRCSSRRSRRSAGALEMRY